MYLQSPRQKKIIADLHRLGPQSVIELSHRYQVSRETIRRDIKQLAKLGRAEKFHGGARILDLDAEPLFTQRLNSNIDEKKRVAKKTADQIKTGATLLLDNSSTACFLARELVLRPKLTVVTFSLEIGHIFAMAGGDHTVYLPGGSLSHEDRSIVGQSSIDFMSQFTPDYFIFSVVAASASNGLLDINPFEASFKRKMFKQSNTNILMVDSTKFTNSGLIHICDWDVLDILVTDDVPEPVHEAMHHGTVCLA